MEQRIDHVSSNGRHFHAAVIGGGASGALSAIQLLQLKLPIVAHVFNDGLEVGRGIAYSAPSTRLILNVPARNMSAFPDAPAHFIEWLEKRYGTRYTSDSFVPRHIYGDYLRDTLQAVTDSSPARLNVYRNRVTKLVPRNHGYAILYGDQEVFANTVILALGNPPPADPNPGDRNFIQDVRYISNPREDSEKILQIRGNGTVVILGSGLTAVDMILQLREQGYEGKIVLISRRGLWPSEHKPGLTPVPCSFQMLKGLSPHQTVRVLRQQARSVASRGGDWRQVIDGLRPETNNLWAGWTFRQRQSFIRHLQPYWNAHRHRMSPDVWHCVNREIQSGAAQLKAGRVVAIRPEKNTLVVGCRPRRRQTMEELHARFVINCTGSETLQRECCQELIQLLLEQNLGQLDPLGHGLATASNGALLNADGHIVRGLYTIGPLRRGKLWETTAIPEIRAQAKAIAEEICHCLTAETQ